MMMSVGTLKRLPPSPPKRQSECVTVVADLHCPSPPAPAPSMPPTTNWSGLHTNGSDASFKVGLDIIIFIVQIIISTNKELYFYEVLTKYYKQFTQ